MNIAVDQLLAEAGAMALELRFVTRENEQLRARVAELEGHTVQGHSHTHGHLPTSAGGDVNGGSELDP